MPAYLFWYIFFLCNITYMVLSNLEKKIKGNNQMGHIFICPYKVLGFFICLFFVFVFQAGHLIPIFDNDLSDKLSEYKMSALFRVWLSKLHG